MTTTQSKQTKPPKATAEALFVWGRFRDFKREHFYDRTAADLMSGMTDAMKADFISLVPMAADWLASMQTELDETGETPKPQSPK